VSATIATSAWIACIRDEYLNGYIRDGGASIKFAVPLNTASRDLALAAVKLEAATAGYLFASLRAEEIRMHLIDQVCFRIAAQIDWNELTRRVIERLAEKAGYQSVTERSGRPLFDDIAQANDIDPKVVLMEMRQRLTADVFKRRALSKDFRVAMFQLCMATLTGEPVGAVEALTEWLTGRNSTIAAVKPYFIFNRIGRANARHLLESLFHWVRFAGFPGLVILVDIARFDVAKNTKDEQVYYTKAAVLDGYEVFRQFVDATDRLTGCLMIVVPDANFVDEGNARGISAYAALKLRIFDEVHDRRLVNPMGCLVRLQDGSA